MPRRPLSAEPERWTVGWNGWGRPVILDAQGVPITRHPDPLVSLEQAYLAAAAPMLRHAVAPLIWRLQRIEVDHGIPIMDRDDSRIGWAWGVLHECAPPLNLYERVLEQRHQGELDWSDDAA